MTAGGATPLSCAAFLIAAFMLAGLCQAMWLGSSAARPFAVPIDGGRTWRGRRLFGDNKTWRGVVVMVPATGVSFAVLAALLQNAPFGAAAPWPLSSGAYALLGLWAGLGFMAGELPNSFLKRQLDIAPGTAAHGPLSRPLWFLIDHVDSAVGMMLAISPIVTIPSGTWIYVALVGPLVHSAYSLLVFQLGGKTRAA